MREGEGGGEGDPIETFVTKDRDIWMEKDESDRRTDQIERMTSRFRDRGRDKCAHTVRKKSQMRKNGGERKWQAYIQMHWNEKENTWTWT